MAIIVPNAALYENTDPISCPHCVYDDKHGRYDDKAYVASKQLAQAPSTVSPFRLTAK